MSGALVPAAEDGGPECWSSVHPEFGDLAATQPKDMAPDSVNWTI